MKELKDEYKPGGAKRQYILDKAVAYLKDNRLMATQQARHAFCTEELMMTESEYLECLNKASGGELWKSAQ